jgi:pyruvate/2-oxoglutarate dehydrogenase complex dihydrolipoamide dehydrogenase (E3) component
MAADGVAMYFEAKVAEVSQQANAIQLRLDLSAARGGIETSAIAADALLIAVGRTPNIEDLDLAAAGVAFDASGVGVDDHLRTSNRRIFAAGDVCSRFKFTHAADAMARVVIQNALFFGRARASALVIPWCTYTDPEVAHVGSSADGARGPERPVETITVALEEVDRAVVDEERDGFVRVHHRRGRLVGCTVVSSRAGEMIAVPTDALMRHASLNQLAATIHPYPTQTAAFRAVGDIYRRSRLTPRVRAILKQYFRVW